MGHKGELSDRHTHKDGSTGYDINIRSHDGHGDVDHKMHVTDYSGSGESSKGVLSSIAEAAGSVFDAIFGGNKDKK